MLTRLLLGNFNRERRIDGRNHGGGRFRLGKHREAAAQTSEFKHMRATYWTDLEVLIARLTLFYSETIVDVQRKRFLNFVTTHVNLGFGLRISDWVTGIHIPKFAINRMAGQ